MLATLADYNEAIKCADGKLLVIDFTASWCPPCQMIAPKFAELSESVKDTATLVKVDVDDNAEAAQAAGIQCMPTFKFFKAGAEVHKMEGANYDGLVAKINELK